MRREVAYIAYHFHWTLREVLSLSHTERIAWVGQISRINQTILEAEP